MNYLNTALIRLSIFFTAGILTGFFLDLPLFLLFIFFSLSFLGFLIAYQYSKRLFLQDLLFGGTTFLLFFLTGILTTQLHLPANQPGHYIHSIPSEDPAEKPGLLLVSISEELKPDLYNHKFVAELEKFNDKEVHGKILISVSRDSMRSELSVDDKLLVSSALQAIPAPLNPHQFDYQKFMENRGVLRQVFVGKENFIPLAPQKTSLRGLASKWRDRIIEKLQQNDLKDNELAVVQALLLGQRQDISEEIYNSYAAAGVIHILAVSGLHVGIILLLLHKLFSPLDRTKKGRLLKTFLLIFSLWLFALLAGLSPSVVRAVTMFSFVAVGLQIKRRTSILNTLFLSMLVILLVRPQFIFEVGFQLSYLAVFSIVLLQPPLYKLLEPRNRIMKYMWGLLTVTIAAQAGVLPLSLFYFHQFPGLFFISNLVILPFMGIILAMGILVIVLALFGLLPSFLADVYSFAIQSLNNFVQFIALQEGFLFRDIYFSGIRAVAFYFFLIALFLLLKRITYRRILICLTGILILQLVFYVESYTTASEELVIFQKSRHTIIGNKSGSNLMLSHNLPKCAEEQALIKNYMVGENISEVNTEELQNFYASEGNILMVIDSTGIYNLEGINPEYVLLTNSPKLNLERLLIELNPKVVIADGSNYRSYVERWKETCIQANIPFHYTATKGAFKMPF